METKRSRFEKVASKRVQYIIDKLELLSNCSNRNNYEYTEDDVRKMFAVIRDQVKMTESKFNDEVSRKTKKRSNSNNYEWQVSKENRSDKENRIRIF